jgi:MSHA biogenesis protein MshN
LYRWLFIGGKAVMSLLNEMLKDLRVESTRDKLPFSLVVHTPTSLFKSWSTSFPWIIFAISLATFLILFFSHKGKLAQVNHPKIEASSVQNNVVSPQMSAQIQSREPEVVANVSQSAAAEWMPSVIVPAPEFHQYTSESTFPGTIQDPFLDENDSNQVNKIFSGLSPKEWYEEQFNKALDAIEEGNNHQAIYVLELILAKFPAAMDVRESLSAIYFSDKEYSQAEAILDEGLSIQPSALNLNIMKARLLYDQNKYIEALKLLNRFHPDIHAEPDFYGLKAAILQTVGQVNEAGSLYKALVALQALNGQYWLGYGLALEEKHAVQQAVAAYKRASESFDIEPAVRSYAEERLKILQG